MHHENGSFGLGGAACNLRHVNKLWNETVVKILWKCNQPLYNVYLDEGNEQIPGFFSKMFSTSSDMNTTFPPFNAFTAVCLPSNIVDGNLNTLLNFLNICGSGLLHMRICFEVDLPYSDIRFAVIPMEYKLALPRLKKLNVIVSIPPGPETPNVISGLNLVKTILSGSENTLTDCIWDDSCSTFESVILPGKITTLSLACDFRSNNFKLLWDSSLPYLTCLTLKLFEGPFPSLFRCLDKYRAQLKILSFENRHLSSYQGPPRNPTLVRFPVMEKLEQLSIQSIAVELELGLRSLETLFPKLVTIRLGYQTGDMLLKWTIGSKLNSVTTLELLMADENCKQDDPSFLQNLNAELMERVNFTFPQLRKLKMGFAKTDPSGLCYVFGKMRNLTELKLIVVGSQDHANADDWDALLTGMPMETIERYKIQPSILLTNHVIEDGTPSIGNLKELKTWHIQDMRRSPSTMAVSDFTLQFALIQMPNLQSVCLFSYNQLLISDEMIDKWKLEGRRLVVSNRPDFE